MDRQRRRKLTLNLEALDGRVLPSPMVTDLAARRSRAESVSVAPNQQAQATQRLQRVQFQADGRLNAARFGGQFRTAARIDPTSGSAAIPSGPFYYNSSPGTATDGGPVIVRGPGGIGPDARPAARPDDPQNTVGVPPIGFYYSSTTVPANDGGFAIARGGLIPRR